MLLFVICYQLFLFCCRISILGSPVDHAEQADEALKSKWTKYCLWEKLAFIRSQDALTLLRRSLYYQSSFRSCVWPHVFHQISWMHLISKSLHQILSRLSTCLALPQQILQLCSLATYNPYTELVTSLKIS